MWWRRLSEAAERLWVRPLFSAGSQFHLGLLLLPGCIFDKKENIKRQDERGEPQEKRRIWLTGPCVMSWKVQTRSLVNSSDDAHNENFGLSLVPVERGEIFPWLEYWCTCAFQCNFQCHRVHSLNLFAFIPPFANDVFMRRETSHQRHVPKRIDAEFLFDFGCAGHRLQHFWDEWKLPNGQWSLESH